MLWVREISNDYTCWLLTSGPARVRRNRAPHGGDGVERTHGELRLRQFVPADERDHRGRRAGNEWRGDLRLRSRRKPHAEDFDAAWVSGRVEQLQRERRTGDGYLRREWKHHGVNRAGLRLRFREPS